EFFPGGNPSPQTHATFVSAPACGQSVPVDAAFLDHPDFHLIMVVNARDAELPSVCTAPSAMPWLAANPATGALGYGESRDVALAFDAGALAPGSYDATMCVTTNDADHAVVEVPLHVQVDADPDRVFADGFEP
ncbi:MAG TPA: hypothetical protein VGC30_09125, partial [Dokdonella sp.]